MSLKSFKHKKFTSYYFESWLVSDQLANETEGGVTKSLSDIPGHWGLNRTSRVYVPAGREIISTVTPGFG